MFKKRFKALNWLLASLLLAQVACGNAPAGAKSNNNSGVNPPPNPQPDPPPVIDPNILNFYGCYFRQNPSMPSDSELQLLAQYHAVILDIELCDTAVVGKLRRLNPNLLIGFYVNPQDIFVTAYDNRPWQNSIRDDLLAHYDNPSQGLSFFVYDVGHQQKQHYWMDPPMYLMNLSASCPRINGKIYSEYISDKIVHKLFWDNPNADEIDFIVLDNALRDYAWMSDLSHVTTLDANWNGINDKTETGSNAFTAQVNVLWRNGFSNIIAAIKNAAPVRVIGNQPNNYFPQLDGKQFEGIASGIPGPADYNFGALTVNPAGSLEILENYLLPAGFTFNIIQAGTVSRPSEQLAETAIVIAMLNGENLVTFRFNSTWRPDSALIEPGSAQGNATTTGVFRVREFTNCWVVFNTSNSTSTIYLGGIGYSVSPASGKIILK